MSCNACKSKSRSKPKSKSRSKSKSKSRTISILKPGMLTSYGYHIDLPVKERQEASHMHTAVFSPDEKFLITTNLGTDKISQF